MQKKIATIFKEIETISVFFQDMSPQQIAEYYLLVSGAPHTPYSESQKLVKWFNERFKGLMRYDGVDKETKKTQLAQEFLLKANNLADKSIRRIFIGKNNEDAHPKRISYLDLGKYHNVYMAETTTSSGLLLFKMHVDSSPDGLMEGISSIPGVAMKNSAEKPKAPRPAPVKKEEKPKSSDFTKIFSGGGGGSAAKKETFTLPHSVHLAIPSSFVAEKNGLPVVDDKGNILEDQNLVENIKKDVDSAKAAGAKWDRENKLWFIPKNTPLDAFKQWMPDEVEKRIYGEVSAADVNFAKSLITRDLFGYGLDMSQEKVLIDQGWQNVSLTGGDPTKKPGSYIAEIHGDKITCTAKTFKTDASKRFTYDIESRVNNLNALVTQTRNFYSANILNARMATSALSGGSFNIALLEEWDENAKICQDTYGKAIPADAAHPYLVKKGLGGMTYTMRSPAWKKSNQELLIPFQDIDGKVWSLQNVPHDTTKKKWIGLSKRKTSSGEYVPRRTRSKGCFYIVNKQPISVSSLPDTILIAEGIATCISLNDVLGYPVVMGVSKGNFDPVITDFLKKYPGTKFIIASDNDLGPDLDNPKPNHGFLAATAVQEKFGSDVISIVECGLSDDERKKGWSDFNDVHSLSENRGEAEKRIVSHFQKVIPPKLSSTLESHASKADENPATHP